jgi:hypothetical protein
MDRVAAPVAAVVFAALLVAAAVAPAASQSVAAARDSVAERPAAVAEQRTATIEKHVELFLTPDEPGRIDVVVGYRLPDAVSSLSVSLPDRTTAVETSDFEETPDDYEWDGDGDTAQLRVTVDANVSARGSRSGEVAQDGEYSFQDAGDWALVNVPSLRTGWAWSGPKGLTVDIDEETMVDGDGSSGGEVAYLGDVDEHTRTANGQTFTLAVPERANAAESPEDVLDALAAASGRLQVGDRDDRVWMAVAPTGADWGVRGVEYGGNDAWVLADSRLDDPANVWLHEYVHTRQGYRTADSGRWTMEAAAEYYASSLSLELGYVEFREFQDYLGYGERDPWRDAVLASPSTWASGANYLKGSLVWGDLDRRMRLTTDHEAAMQRVLWTLNRQDAAVTNQDVVAAVRDASGPDVAEAARRFTTTEATPEMWSRAGHRAAFAVDPPRMTYGDTEYRVTGPFRNETFDELPTLYVGETLAVTATVANDGDVSGEYEGAVTEGNATLATDSGTLAGGESGELTVQHALASPGTYNVTLGRDSQPVSVRSPATVQVTELSVDPERVEPGDGVTVTARLSNPSEDPARGPVAVTLDGRQVASLNATLASGASITRSATVTVQQSGRYEVAVGDRTVTVQAGGTATTVPGLGLIGSVFVLAAGAAVAARGRK